MNSLMVTVVALAAAAGGAAPPADDGVEVAGQAAGGVTVPSAPGAWGGERTGREPTLSDRVADYQLRAVLDPVKHTIDGTERLTWRNRGAVAVGSLYLHLYLNAFESKGSTFFTEMARFGPSRASAKVEKGEWGTIELRAVVQGGKPVPWRFVHPDGGPATDHTVVRLDLPEPVAPGGSTVLDLRFFDQLPRVVARTGWFGRFHLVGQWYPKVGVLELPGERGATRPRWNCHEFHLNSEFYADFGSYRLEVVAPAGFTVAASGVPDGAPRAGPEGVVHRFRADDVHDVAFTAWDGFAPPLTATWTGPGSPEVRVQVLYPPEYAAQGREALQATVDALGFFSRTLFPYPYAAVTCVIPPFNTLEAAGMEYETFFTSMASNSFPLDAAGFTRYVTVHEFGHGYFMGLIASNEFEEPFLDEGMNELWDVRMLEGERLALSPPAPLRLLGLALPAFGYLDRERLSGITRFPADALAQSAWNRWSRGSYASIYPRSVLAFRDLEREVGAGPFARGMSLYARRWRFRHPSTADLEAALVDGGADPARVRRFFAEQVYGVAQPDDRLERLDSAEVLPVAGLVERDGKRVERDAKAIAREVDERRRAWRAAHGAPAAGKPGPFPWLTVVAARRLGALDLPHQLVVTFEDGSTREAAWPAGERWGRWSFEAPVPARSAELDPGAPWATDLARLDDGRTRKPAPAAARRWGADAWAWLQLLFATAEAL